VQLRVGKLQQPRDRGRRAATWLPPPERGSATNPYRWLLCDALAGCGVPPVDVGDLTFAGLWRARRTVRFLHFNWRPDRCYAPCIGLWPSLGKGRVAHACLQLGRFALILAWARLLGFCIVWTIHEVRPPRVGAGVWIDRAGLRLLARASDLLIAHSRATAARLAAEVSLPLRVAIVPHPSFAGVYASPRPAEELRARLEIPDGAFVLLCFGMLRADKHVALLLEAFAALDLPDVYLVIAGAAAHPPSRRLAEAAAERDGRIRLLLQKLSDQHVAEMFGIADAFVLPRSEVWTSGSLVLSLSLGVPAIAARLEPAVDLLGEDAAGWLFEPGDAGSLSAALRAAASDHASTAQKRAIARIRGAELPSWEEVAGQMARLFGAATGDPGGGDDLSAPNGRVGSRKSYCLLSSASALPSRACQPPPTSSSQTSPASASTSSSPTSTSSSGSRSGAS
jgi:glycosyltransferase involved in cell wall biosynthesis